VQYRKINAKKSVRPRQANDGNAVDIQLGPKDEFRIKTFLPVVDALSTNLKRRADVYSNVAKKFSFLTNFNQPLNQCMEAAHFLKECYPDDIGDNLVNELQHLHSYIKTKKLQITTKTKKLNN
jgi:hypothetical protein